MLVLSASLLLAPLAQGFDPVIPITKRIEQVSRTLSGDFNGDGEADLVLFSRIGTTGLIRLGDGSGSLRYSSSAPAPTWWCRKALAATSIQLR